MEIWYWKDVSFHQIYIYIFSFMRLRHLLFLTNGWCGILALAGSFRLNKNQRCVYLRHGSILDLMDLESYMSLMHFLSLIVASRLGNGLFSSLFLTLAISHKCRWTSWNYPLEPKDQPTSPLWSIMRVGSWGFFEGKLVTGNTLVIRWGPTCFHEISLELRQ